MSKHPEILLKLIHLDNVLEIALKFFQYFIYISSGLCLGVLAENDFNS